MNKKKEDVFKLILKKYEKRNELIKAGAGEEELAENKGNIEDLIDRYVEEYIDKVGERRKWIYLKKLILSDTIKWTMKN